MYVYYFKYITWLCLFPPKRDHVQSSHGLSGWACGCLVDYQVCSADRKKSCLVPRFHGGQHGRNAVIQGGVYTSGLWTDCLGCWTNHMFPVWVFSTFHSLRIDWPSGHFMCWNSKNINNEIPVYLFCRMMEPCKKLRINHILSLVLFHFRDLALVILIHMCCRLATVHFYNISKRGEKNLKMFWSLNG